MNDIFAETIVKQLPEVKLLVSILSPCYVKSEWCVREVAEFCKAAEAQGGVRIKDKSRVFKVVKTPVPPSEYPPPLFDVFNSQLGFEFYEMDAETGRPREFTEEFGEEAKQRYFERVYDVAYEIHQFLKTCRPETPTAAAAKPASGKTVYLAMTTSDLQAERDRIQRELVERGHRVLPDAPLPTVASEFEAAVRSYLDRCEMSVHMLGNRYGMIPEDAACSVVELQNAFAAERASSPGFSRIIWIAKGLQACDERQGQFLRRVREDAEAQRGAEVIEDTVEKLKGLIQEKVEPPPKKEAQVAPVTPGGPSRVYLICDPRDEAQADPIEDFLFNRGLEVTRPFFEGSEAEVNSAHRQNLQLCDAALIFYGAASRAWVDMKLMDLMQAPGYGRSKAIKAQAVCVAPPDDRNKQRFRTPSAQVLRLAEPVSPDQLMPFVQQVTSA